MGLPEEQAGASVAGASCYCKTRDTALDCAGAGRAPSPRCVSTAGSSFRRSSTGVETVNRSREDTHVWRETPQTLYDAQTLGGNITR
jgi:hypothetical protein